MTKKTIKDDYLTNEERYQKTGTSIVFFTIESQVDVFLEAYLRGKGFVFMSSSKSSLTPDLYLPPNINNIPNLIIIIM